jgi:hypothetical protein
MGAIERFEANQDESTVVYNVPLLASSGRDVTSDDGA